MFFLDAKFSSSDHFLSSLYEAQFYLLRDSFNDDSIPTVGRVSDCFSSSVSTTDTSSSAGNLKASSFKVNMLSRTKHKLQLKDLVFKDLENTIQKSLFSDDRDRMESFIDTWSNHLQNMRYAIKFHIVHEQRKEYKVSLTQPLIQKFIEGMIHDVALPGSIAIDKKARYIPLEVNAQEYHSIMGQCPTVKARNDRYVIPLSARPDLMFNLFTLQSTENISHFEVKKTGVIERGKGMPPREQVIATNLALAAEEGVPIVRGMTLNFFVGSLVWFIAPDDSAKSLTEGVHYIEHRVYRTRDMVIRILACLMDISKDQISSLMETETAETIVLGEEGREDSEIHDEADFAAKKGSDTACHSAAEGGARAMGGSLKEASFPFGPSSKQRLHKRNWAGETENQNPQSHAFGPFLTSSELEKLGACRRMGSIR